MKLLLITGASSGIGLATAQRFLAEGFNVFNLSRRPCPDDQVQQLSCDLSDPDFYAQIAKTIQPTLEVATTITLIHNASRLENDSAVQTPSTRLREVLEVNLIAPNTLNAAVIPFMQPGSSILYVGSTLSEKAVPGSFSYVVSKHGIVGMMRATCQDLAGRGIHTACICPGFTDTEMLRNHIPEGAMESIQGLSAFGRLIEPTEIADTLFWASQSPVINGALLHANLGQVER